MGKKLTLAVKTLLMISVVGLVVWFISDAIQTRVLSELFHDRLSERFSNQASEQRIRFDRYVKSYYQAVRLFTSTDNFVTYINSENFRNPERGDVISYHDTPPWLPKISVIRKFVQPRYAMLLDGDNKVKEIYHHQSVPHPPPGLMQPSSILILQSTQQSYLTSLQNVPYVVTSDFVTDKSGKRLATLVIASPLDEEFLITSQGPSAYTSTIALLKGENNTIIASNNRELIPVGTTIDSLKDRYLVTGEAFFDYGATDMLIRFISLTSTEEIKYMSGEVLNTERSFRAITALVFIVTFVLIMLWIIRRVQKLTRKVVDFSEYMNLPSAESSHGDQLQVLEDRFLTLTEKIRQQTESLEHQARHDPLTGLPNRKFLINDIEREIHRSRRNKTSLSLLVMDLDHFKEINDTLGHHIGDRVLQQAAERLSVLGRKTDVVARLGGDEFSILLPETTSEGAKQLAEQIVSSFEKPFMVEGHNLSVGISIGITDLYDEEDNVNALVQRADIAMYIAKREKTGYQIYDLQKDQYSRNRLELMTELRHAMEEEKLELYYQPIADLRTGEIVSVEALLRWAHPQKGDIPPDIFIPLAEQTGLIRPLTNWVIDTALKQCAQWDKTGLSITMSVNLSVFNLHDAALPDQIKELLTHTGLAPERLKLEITETDIMMDPIRAKDILNRLDAMGVTLSVDDFGTGYSSLVYLKQLPVDELKIDRSFVGEMTRDENDATIVRAIVDLAHHLGLKVVAEGVIDLEILKMLQTLDCDYAQGYFIHTPLPAQSIMRWTDTSAWIHKGILPLIPGRQTGKNQ